MKNRFSLAALSAVACLGLWSLSAQAVTFEAGDWIFTANGHVNINYVYTGCDSAGSAGQVDQALLCVSGPDEEDSASSVASGNLPTGLIFGAESIQGGLDIGAKFGFYPGLVSNDFGSSGPNLPDQDTIRTGEGVGLFGRNSALASSNLDIRQAYGTIGSDNFGSLKLGRDYLPVGLDAILNDITVIAVGVSSVFTARAPNNTSLGSIGFGHLFPTPQAQITYTTPNLGGFSGSVGIFNPIDAFTFTGNSADSNGPIRDLPGFHGKLGYAGGSGSTTFALSSSALFQEHELNSTAVLDGNRSADSFVVDVFGQINLGPFSALAYVYTGEGVGIYSYFIEGFSADGEERDSDGGLFQGAVTLGKTKFGVNYGISSLDQNAIDADTLINSNEKLTFGIYHTLTPNVTVTSEFTTATADNHAGGDIETETFNVGTFISF